MNWSLIGVIVPTICYLIAAMSEIYKGNQPMALVLFGYSIANVGLLWAMVK
jgi:hypothetical protein